MGRLTQDRHGELGFEYEGDWVQHPDAPALSASLPKREGAYRRRECRPFFAGLLPDEGQREAVARALGVSPGNDFALLERLGGDVAGALQLLPSGESPAEGVPDAQPEPLDDAALARVVDTLPIRPLLAGDGNLSLSLAGAQSKLPVVLVAGAVALPARGSRPRTYSSPRWSASRARPRTKASPCVSRWRAASMSRPSSHGRSTGARSSWWNGMTGR